MFYATLLLKCEWVQTGYDGEHRPMSPPFLAEFCRPVADITACRASSSVIGRLRQAGCSTHSDKLRLATWNSLPADLRLSSVDTVFVDLPVLLQTAGLRSCSAIARRTDPAALRTREVKRCSASSWPSACRYNAFAVYRENVCLPPIHCEK